MTTPRTDAEFDRLRFEGEPEEFSQNTLRDNTLFGMRDFARQLETELIALQLEYEKACEEILSLRQERDQLLATVEGLRAVIENGTEMMFEDSYHLAIPLEDANKMLESIPPTNLVKRGVLEKQ